MQRHSATVLAATAFAVCVLSLRPSILVLAALVVVAAGITAFFRAPADRVVGWALVAVVFLHVLVPVQRAAVLGSFADRLPLAASAGVVALTAAAGVRRLEIGPLRWPAAWSLPVSYLCLVVLTTWPGDRVTWLGLAAVLVPAGCCFVLAGACNPAERRLAVRAFVVLAALEATYAVYEALVQAAPLWSPAGRTSDGGPRVLLNEILLNGWARAQGTLSHPLPLAMVLLVALTLVVSSDAFRGRLPRLALVGLLLLGIVAAGSRSGLLIALIVLLVSFSRRWLVSAVLGLYGAATAGTALLVFGLVPVAALEALVSGGSFTHRAGALDAVGRLTDAATTTELLFGRGAGSISALFDAGLLQDDGFRAVDNQMVTTYATTGLVGVGLVLSLVVLALVRGRLPWLTPVFATAAMGLSFDVLLWPVSAALVAVVVAFAVAPPPSLAAGDVAGGDPAVSGDRSPDSDPATVPEQLRPSSMEVLR